MEDRRNRLLMSTLLIFIYLAVIVLGVYLHKTHEAGEHTQAKVIDFTRLYLNIVVPIALATIAFNLVLEILRYPAYPILIGDTALFYGLLLSAAVCFLGSGMHITTKLLSPFIENTHAAYRINRFYHIYVGHIFTYTGFLLFVLCLSLFALKRPADVPANAPLYIGSGIVSGLFLLRVAKTPPEIAKIYWPILFSGLFLYFLLIIPHRELLLRSPTSLFFTSAAATLFALMTLEISFHTAKKVKRNLYR